MNVGVDCGEYTLMEGHYACVNYASIMVLTNIEHNIMLQISSVCCLQHTQL